MRYSKLFGQASKTTGKQLSIRSHRYLVQAGYIRESVAGRYYFLPLGQRVHNKITRIIRQEMDQVSQEMVTPILHPLKLWQETNRDRAAGFELMKVRDRRGADFALGGTAEEMFVDLIRGFNLSYKDLPLNIYQFGLKFRDELRARGGLLRVREFIMKDAYSFSTPEQFEDHYDLMRKTYTKIFSRLGLETIVIPADGGYIGGDYCHEFLVPSQVGESPYLTTKDGYLAHQDVAQCDKPKPHQGGGQLKQVEAKREKTIQAAIDFHQPSLAQAHIKNVAYLASDQVVIACLPGNFEVCEPKLAKALGGVALAPLNDEQVVEWLNSAPGFISPVNLKPKRPVKVVADESLVGLTGGISGANLFEKDYIGIDFDKDIKPDLVTDIVLASPGQTFQGQELSLSAGIEVGNIFQLGFHYSQKMKGANYTDSNGQAQPYYMGCYGIGLGRTLAAIAQVYSDEKGLRWPKAVAPFDVYLARLGDDEGLVGKAERLVSQLEEAGLEVLYDDRDGLRPGEKLATADLVGLPYRVIVSPRNDFEGLDRQTGKTISLQELIEI